MLDVAHLGMLQHSLGVLPDGGRGLAGGVSVGLDPADVLSAPEAPLGEAMPPSVQPLRTPTPVVVHRLKVLPRH